MKKSNITPLQPVRSVGAAAKAPPPTVIFDRHELSLILRFYGRMVAAGEWRDYAIGDFPDQAVFAIFRRTSEMPLYRIVKRPKLAHRQGAYQILSATGQIVKRGSDLAQVLRFFDRQWMKLVHATQ